MAERCSGGYFEFLSVAILQQILRQMSGVRDVVVVTRGIKILWTEHITSLDDK